MGRFPEPFGISRTVKDPTAQSGPGIGTLVGLRSVIMSDLNYYAPGYDALDGNVPGEVSGTQEVVLLVTGGIRFEPFIVRPADAEVLE